MTPQEFEAKRQFFSTRRCHVYQGNAGPDQGFDERFYPKIGGKFVRNADDPKDGFKTRGEALAAAHKFQRASRDFKH